MNAFRARFIGKVSPVHFFWGSFDLAVTRFSGRTAPPPTSVTPNVANWVMAEAYSHEVSSWRLLAGQRRLWPRRFLCLCVSGAGRLRRHPPVDKRRFLRQKCRAVHLALHAVRAARDPDALLLSFLQETHAAAADLARWDRKVLERA
jgi:hypothetical protein